MTQPPAPVDEKTVVENKLIALIHTKNTRASSETAMVLGQIIEAMGLSSRYLDYAKETGSKAVSLKDLT